ncbi:hypothetical protein ABCS02_01715 [Microbacterium sp. X-17]|uniref:DUF7882 family protein n=1 Tax=Microbacterium sp. X-17 TaxID=3144404 RepID=UPI0031F54DC3
MGTLTYDGDTITFEDRTLAHLQAAITTKLRRREPFLMSWRCDEPGLPARKSLWIDNSIPIRYEFDSAELGRLNSAWLNSMVEMAGRTSGLLVTEEPKELSEYRDRRSRVSEQSVAAS